MTNICHSKSALDTPAFALIAEGWNDLVQSGWTPELCGACPVDGEHEVLYAAREDGEIVGVLCFAVRCSHLQISLGYVEPTSRRQGVYGALYAAVLDLARTRDVRRVISQVHPDNQVARRVEFQLHRQLASLTYETIVV